MDQQISYQQNAPLSDMYQAFMDGFSDYIIRFDMDAAGFESTFLVRDQNQPSRSIVAYADGRPVGVVLSGVAHLETGWVTRCGGLAVSPAFRKIGIARELMRRFDEQATGTRLLEVIQGNDSALALYERLGYETVREIFYFDSVPTETEATRAIEPIVTLFNRYYPSASHRPIWQTDARTTQQRAELVRITEGDKTGALLFRSGVLLDVFGRDEDAEWLLRAAAANGPIKLTLTSDRPALIEAARTLGFKQDAIAQFEMVKRETGV
ncbi:GNAT family N-acetyltransferase [Exiguobacterium sp. SH3S2]|uniref:GNAT family N-acetyltransferase n=1 Tax=unclassified Exiguobacterium TaxID=2644629 RepID=UPI00103C50EB|nr:MULTISPECIES: GNAT family N-acetyltransferase [unclassified Exiguobacterium]TCI43192.1 GNAT family N-acetyltransferase [Exiguobacterium sp. SH3S3]TCI58963.1 GNAT family N-acetyltransferase [Exiguobacterium sp. SH3S2]